MNIRKMIKSQNNIIPVLDTNMLHADPDLLAYEGQVIYIPVAVYSELDRQKTEPGEKGFKARAINGRLNFPKPEDNFSIYHDGSRKIAVLSPDEILEGRTFPGAREEKADEAFLNMVILDENYETSITDSEEKQSFILHTADRSLAHLMSLDRRAVKFIKNPNRVFLENIYSGHEEIYVTDEQFQNLNLINAKRFNPNQYLLISSTIGTRLGKVKGGKVVKVRDDINMYGISPRNLEQKFLFDALNDDDVKIIILSGRAGTGKTMLSLAAGLQGIDNRKYDQLILAKSLAPLSKNEEVGFLPGDLMEKLIPQFANYTSNFEVLMGGKSKPIKKDGIVINVGEARINYLMDKGELALMSLDSVLGASYDKKFVVVDECQSLNFDTLKCLCQRITDNSKLILLGDILQQTSAMSSPDKSALFIANRFLQKANSVATLSLSKVERGKCCQEVGAILEEIQI